jgi:hypothetical protein
MSEPLMGLLAELRSAELDAGRDVRIRNRCRAQIARTRTSVSRRESQTKGTHVWEPLIAVLGVAYLAEVIVQALRALPPQ